MARLQTEALERRQQLLRDQSSPLNTPSARIKLWKTCTSWNCRVTPNID